MERQKELLLITVGKWAWRLWQRGRSKRV